MKTTRTVSNPLALAILGEMLVASLHPYEIARRLDEHEKGRDFKFTRGSVYMVIEQLERAGFVAEEASIRDSERPERTVYSITDAGREEFFDWMRELVAQPAHEYPLFGAALSLLSVIPPAEAATLLTERGVALDAQITAIRASLQTAGKDGVQWIFLIEEEYRLKTLETELTFVRQLILSLGEPAYQRAWHEFFERQK